MMPVQMERPKRSRSLTATLALAFLALSVTVLIVASSFEMYFSVQTQREAAASNQRLIAQDAANTVASFIQERFSILEAAIRLSDLVSASQKEQQTVLENLLGAQPAFRHLVLLDSQDQELARVSRLSQAAAGKLMDRAASDLFAQVKQGSRYIGPVYVDEVTSEPMVLVAIPATDVFGDFQGTLIAEVNLKFMWDLVGRLEVGETGLAYVVDRQGGLIAFDDISRVLRGENVSYLREVGEFVSNPALIDETGAGVSRGISGVTVVGTYVPLGTPDWAVVTELPVVEAYRGVIRSAAISAGVMLVMAVLAGLIGVAVARRLAVPLLTLTETATRIAGGEIDLQAAMEGPTQVIDLARAFNSMTAQLRELIGSLEQRVAERTRNLEASAQVARAATSILEIDRLIRGIVELIRERLGLHYVGLFLTDEAGEWAVLRAGTGGAGRAMLARGHRIRLGEGMVGWSIAHAQARVAREVGADAVRLATAELPDTRSEAALALRSRGQVLGALTVQSDRPGAFDEQTIAVLQTMADQVAAAIDNARLFAETQAALEAERRAYGELSAQAWGELLRTRTDWGYRYASRVVAPVEGDWSPEMRRAEQTGRSVQALTDAGTEDGGPALAIPIRVRGQVIGVLRFRKGRGSETWTAEEVALLETMVAQLDVALESARLYHDSQRREIRERIVGQFTARVRQTLDLETVLETAVQEVQQSLDLPEVMIRLATRWEDDGGAERTEAE
jgi:GAF domain-containing protein/HAMP domain-containing protein